MENNSVCVPDHTSYTLNIAGTTTCGCKSSYSGTHCEFYNSWQAPIKLTDRIQQTVIAVLIVVWFIYILVILVKPKKFAWNLSFAAMLLNLLANLVLISYIWIPQDCIQITDDNL